MPESVRQSNRVTVQRAFEDLLYVFRHPEHPDYLEFDRVLAKKYGISYPTYLLLRSRMGVMNRPDRLLNQLQNMGTEAMYLFEIVEKFGGRVKYQTLYKMMVDHKIPFLRQNKDERPDAHIPH